MECDPMLKQFIISLCNLNLLIFYLQEYQGHDIYIVDIKNISTLRELSFSVRALIVNSLI